MRQAKRWSEMFRTAGANFVNDYAMSMGAAIAFYTTFSLAPLLVIVIAVAGAVFGPEAVQGQIVSEFSDVIGRDGATMVQALVASASRSDRSGIASGVSVVLLLVASTTVLAELQSSLDRIWHVPLRQRPSGLRGIMRTRLLSFGLILGVAFLMIVSLIVSAVLSAAGQWISQRLPGSAGLLWLGNFVLSLGIFTGLFAMIYKLLPTKRPAWRDVGVGALTTAVLFEIGKLLIGLYIGQSHMAASYKAAGSVVVLLAWVYYAALIFLYGAEFTRAYALARSEGLTPPGPPASA